MPRALITGIAGFAGPWLAAHLLGRGIECVGLSHGSANPSHPISLRGLRIHDVDIRDRAGLRQLLRAENPDFVYHLAAVSHVPTSRANPELTFDANVGGTFNLLENLRQLGSASRVVFVSSGNLYGQTESGEDGFTEDSPLEATSPYATSKLIGEQLALSYVRDFGLPIMIARPFNHTGPGQAPSFVCPEFARAIAAGAVGNCAVHLRTGLLEIRRDISDVRDVVRAYALLAERGRPGGIWNVCSGSTVSMADILRILAELAHVQVTTEPDPARVRPREILRSGGNRSKISRDLGWTPEIPLTRTLQDLLDYWIAQERGVPWPSTSGA